MNDLLNASYVIPAPARTVVPVERSGQVFAVRRIYCVGRNYRAHVREMKGDEREPPFFFQKPTDSIVLDGAEITYPPETKDFQHEVELVVAIGRAGSSIAEADVIHHVFGFAVGIDLTRRDLQFQARDRGRPWEVGKSFDASAPISAIKRLDVSSGIPASGRIALSVNGSVRQTGDLSEMIWSSAEIISNLSRLFRLEAGDLIYTGTPAGVGPLVPGDQIECAIEGVGKLSVKVANRATAGSARSPVRNNST
jgi:fumarylpyruvate hydrolase